MLNIWLKTSDFTKSVVWESGGRKQQAELQMEPRGESHTGFRHRPDKQNLTKQQQDMQVAEQKRRKVWGELGKWTLTMSQDPRSCVQQSREKAGQSLKDWK